MEWMNPANWTAEHVQTAAAVAGVVVAAVGFFFVARQLRRGAHSDIYTLAVAIRRTLLQYPDLWPYFHDGRALTDEDERTRCRVAALADTYCLYLEQIALYAGELGGEKHEWFRYIRKTRANSPAIIAHLNDNPHYARPLYRALKLEYPGPTTLRHRLAQWLWPWR